MIDGCLKLRIRVIGHWGHGFSGDLCGGLEHYKLIKEDRQDRQRTVHERETA